MLPPADEVAPDRVALSVIADPTAASVADVVMVGAFRKWGAKQ